MKPRGRARGILLVVAPRAEFPSTIWTAIQAAPEKARASVCNLYREPVYAYLLRQGLQQEDAEDLTQEVFIRVCAEQFLKKVAPSKGKFRSLLLAVARNVILKSREKSRRRREVSIDVAFEPAALPAEQDPDFDRLWKQNLVREALVRLKKEAATGAPPYADVIRLVKLEGKSYADVAAKLGAAVSDVTNWVFHGKQRMRYHLRELVMAYCSTSVEYKQELEMMLVDFK